MAGEFWLDDEQWAAIEPLLPTHQSGAHRKDDRRIISGIIHVLKTGCRWQDCPECYGPPTTIYNRFHRWSARGSRLGMTTGWSGVTTSSWSAAAMVMILFVDPGSKIFEKARLSSEPLTEPIRLGS